MPSVAKPFADPHVRNGVLAAALLATICLLMAVVSPAAGAVAALVFVAAARGIQRGRAWAGIAAICFLLPPILVLMTYRLGVALACLAVAGVFVYFLARASVVLFRRPSGWGGWPWIPIAALTVLFWLAIHPYAITGSSMERTILHGDHVVVEVASWRFGRTPRIGDVVVVRNPADHLDVMTKRVVAGPGDRIRIRAGKLHRNGEIVAEPYVRHDHPEGASFQDDFPGTLSIRLDGEAQAAIRSHVENGELVIPEGRYFVLGDNRDNSQDSRDYGFLTRDDIVGSPLLVYGSYVGGQVAPGSIRWTRLLKVPR